MASVTSFKIQRNARAVVTEIGFAKGMQYTDGHIDEGYAKTIVNYDLDSSGKLIKPRGGLKELTSRVFNTGSYNIASDATWKTRPDVSYSGLLYTAEGATFADPVLRQVTVMQSLITDESYNTPEVLAYTHGAEMFDSFGTAIFIDYEGTIIRAVLANNTETDNYLYASGRVTLSTTPFLDFESPIVKCAPINKELLEMHGLPVTDAANGGLCTVLDSNFYAFGGYMNDAFNHNLYTTYSKSIVLMCLNIWRTTTTQLVDGKTCPVYKYMFIPVVPKNVSPAQAVNYGYNMLLDSPYTFNYGTGVDNDFELLGILPYNSKGELALTAKPGESLTFKLVSKVGNATRTTYGAFRLQWEMVDLQNPSSTPLVLQTMRNSPIVALLNESFITVCPAYKQFALTVKVYGSNIVNETTYVSQVDDNNKFTPLKVMTLASYRLTADNENAGTALRTFDLPTATGMCTWKQRVVVWGVKNAETCIFSSEINDPSWFSYPNGYEQFDGQVLKCVPYLDNLLVFTESRLYSLTLATDGLQYTTKCIQNNLNMTKADAYALLVVKNMIYFKSGNYFYMVVPKASSMTGELQIAPISKPVEYLLDSFSTDVPELLNSMYDFNTLYDLDTRTTEVVWQNDGAGPELDISLTHYQESYDIKLKDYYTYADSSTVHNVYKFKIVLHRGLYESPELEDGRIFVLGPDGKYIYRVLEQPLQDQYVDYILSYNTNLRAWTINIRTSSISRIVPYLNSVTDGAVYCGIFKNIYGTLPLDKQLNNFQWDWKFITMTESNTDCVDDIPTSASFPNKVGNLQYLDTGYRKLNEQSKKRFREVQFFINNISQKTIKFNTEIAVDEDTRKPMYHYITQQITDPADPNYGAIIVTKEIDETVTNTTVLDDPDSNTDDSWYLDFSKFTEINTAKVRVKTSGKGYSIRFRLLTSSEVMYELSTMSWVYRTMNAR